MQDRINKLLRQIPGWAVYLAGVLPFLWIVWLVSTGSIGPDPIREIEHRLGKLALQLILGGLLVTPLRRFLGINALKHRRAIGLLAFFYTVMHVVAWFVLDMGMLTQQAVADVFKRPYLMLGMGATLMLLPLAITSNNLSIRTLGGARWRKLHWLVYPAAVLAAVHFVWLVKAWPPEPLLYLAGVLILLAVRLIPKWRPRTAAQRA